MAEINFEQISKLEDGSCSLDIGNLLDTTNYHQREIVLNVVLSKIGLGDTLTLSGTDISSLFHEFIFGVSDARAVNDHIFNLQSIDTCKKITELLLANKFTIENKKINKGPLCCEYHIIAKRG